MPDCEALQANSSRLKDLIEREEVGGIEWHSVISAYSDELKALYSRGMSDEKSD